MTEEDLRSGEKRRTRRRLDWVVGVGITGFLMFVTVECINFAHLISKERRARTMQIMQDNTKDTLVLVIKECALKDAGSDDDLSYPSDGPTHADVTTYNSLDYIITHSINASKLEPRSSCYSVAAISRDNSMASYQITYNKSTGKLLKTCLPAIKGDNSGCKDGTW